MRNAIISVAVLSAAIGLGAPAGDAQITINLPNIKKIVKPKPTPVTVDTTNTTDTTVTTNTNDNTTTTTTTGNGSTNWWIDYHIGEIAKYKQRLDSWDPAKQYFPKPQSNDDYISLAFSKKYRAEWLADHKVAADPKLDAAFDNLKTSLERRLPEYTINPGKFNNRNAAEEKLMLGALTGVPGIKVFKIGLGEPAWLIDKNEYGIPTARYKHGLVYGRDPGVEDPFCRVWYVNVVQDYSGAGTYGATEARYIEKEFISCPAGK